MVSGVKCFSLSTLHDNKEDLVCGGIIVPYILAYKSTTFFEANFEVFAIFSPISRYQFLPELVYNFRSMNSCTSWFQITIFEKKGVDNQLFA